MKGGEAAFLAWLARTTGGAPDLPVPIGDDAAVLRVGRGFDVVVACDAVAEGTHFTAKTPPRLVGRKALAVNLSDFAAMGAEPRHAFVAAVLPKGFQGVLPRAVTTGIRDLARRFGVTLAGGDTNAHAGGLVLAVTLVGRVRAGRAVTRAGARPGDVIAVTGALGGSLRRGRHLRFTPRVAEGLSLGALGPPSAMIDVSDGLLLDLSRLLRASGVGARVDAAAVPVHADAGRGRRALEAALSDGEDFELLFTMSPSRFRALQRRWPHATPIHAIGEITRRGFTIVREGVERPAAPAGFEHA